MKKKYSFDDLKRGLAEKGLQVLTQECDYANSKQFVDVSNGIYKASILAYNYIGKNSKDEPSWFYVRNPYIIDNINKYLELNCGDNFTCISDKCECITRDTPLKIMCNRCGNIVTKSLHGMRKTGVSRNIVACPNCDGNTESLHALVLKQIFKYYYPDSIEEEKSCINPNTKCVMPTDIVNHRLKIAIEVQGQYHKIPAQKERDLIKKQFWENKQYTFYDYPIDNVPVLTYIQYFFPDLKEIPDWVDFNYNSKLNLHVIQKMLDDGYKVLEIADELSINVHRIYDALHLGNLMYPQDYIKGTRRPVIMLDKDLRYLKEYPSFSDAEIDNEITRGLIASCVYYGTYHSNGHYWIPKDLYTNGFIKQLHNI